MTKLNQANLFIIFIHYSLTVEYLILLVLILIQTRIFGYNCENKLIKLKQLFRDPMITATQTKYDHNKSSISDMSKAITQLQAFTYNLQSKVDGILKAQQLEFLNSYKQHMLKIKLQFDNLNYELKKKDAQILSYENQGKMSNLIKRVNFLQAEQKKLLSDLEKKKRDIKQLQLEREIQKSQIKRLEQKVKQLIRTKSSMEEKIQRQRDVTHQSIPTFSTQIAHQMSKKGLSKIMTQQRSLKLNSLSMRSEKSQISINPQQSEQYNRLQRQVTQLKKQNRQLISFNSKYIEGTSLMQNFFIETVNQIKKNITVRKQVKECSLEDFRKEDKLQLLIKVLSNDQIIFLLYKLIFGKSDNPFGSGKKIEKLSIQRPASLKSKNMLNKSTQYTFPAIKSARLYL